MRYQGNISFKAGHKKTETARTQQKEGPLRRGGKNTPRN